ENAWELVRNWGSPSSRDPVHGQWRPAEPRVPGEAEGVVEAKLSRILEASPHDATGLVVAAELGVSQAYQPLIDVLTNEDQAESLQVRALAALGGADEEIAKQALDAGLASKRARVRSAAQALLVKRFPARAIEALNQVINSATT